MILARPRQQALLVTVLVLVTTGCAVTDPSRYYALSAARPAAPAAPVAPAVGSSPVTVGVGPVSIPGYLDRLQLVTRDASDGLQIWPYHRWAEPLDVGIAQALADDLGARIPGDRVAIFPWRGALALAIDYQAVVAIVRFEGAPGRSVTLDARWGLLGRGNKELAFKRFTLTEPVAEGFPALVASMNRTLAALAQDISQEIQAHAASRAATKD